MVNTNKLQIIARRRVAQCVQRTVLYSQVQRALSTHASTQNTQTHAPFRVLVLGGYGTFGGFVANALAHDPNIALIVAGRNAAQTHACAQRLTQASHAQGEVAGVVVDALDRKQLRAVLSQSKPNLVIHTCGPYQGLGYDYLFTYFIITITCCRYEVAKECIEAGVNYVDLADGREFVCEIGKLDEDAKKKVSSLIPFVICFY